mgnify:CR=1 FL=1
MFQAVPLGIAAVAGLVLYAWKFLVVERLAKESGESTENIARRSKSRVRQTGLALLLLALAWLLGCTVRLATGLSP